MHIETEYNRENRGGAQIWISDDSTTQTTHSYLAATIQSNTQLLYTIVPTLISIHEISVIPKPNAGWSVGVSQVDERINTWQSMT